MLIRIHQTQKFKTFTGTSSLNCNKRGLYSFGPTLLKPVSALKKKKTIRQKERHLKLVWLHVLAFSCQYIWPKKIPKRFAFSPPLYFCLSSPFFSFQYWGHLLICISAWDVSLKFQGIVKVSWRKYAWEVEQEFHWNFLTGQLYIA